MSITYLEAIREAQAKLLRDDERVFIYGQDVGGAFGGAKQGSGERDSRTSRHANQRTRPLAPQLARRRGNAADCRNAVRRFLQYCVNPI